jgi:hypothetical protein
VAAIDKGSNEGLLSGLGTALRTGGATWLSFEGPPTAFAIHWAGKNERIIEGETFEANILNFVGR